MNSEISEYTVYIPKKASISEVHIRNIDRFVVDIKDLTSIDPHEIPMFNAGYGLIRRKDGSFLLQQSDKLNILKIPGGKDYSVGLAHLVSRFYYHPDSSYNNDMRFSNMSGLENPIISMLGQQYNPELMSLLQLVSHNPKLKKSLIDVLQLNNQKIADGLRKILSISSPTWRKSLTGGDMEDLFRELFRSSDSARYNAVRECKEEIGLLMTDKEPTKPYLIINQLKIPNKRGPVIKKYYFYHYVGGVKDIGTIKPSISEAKYMFNLKEYNSPEAAANRAFSMIEDKISQGDWYKMPVGLINARALQHAPE